MTSHKDVYILTTIHMHSRTHIHSHTLTRIVTFHEGNNPWIAVVTMTGLLLLSLERLQRALPCSSQH